MEFIPSPIRFASDIFDRVKSFPTRAGGRLQGLGRNLGFLKNTAVPGLKNVKPRGVGLGGPIALLDAGVRVASGENPYLATGRALSGWGGGALGATVMAPVPVPLARVGGGVAGYGAGTALFDNIVARATDDRGLSGLLRGKGWNNPFAPSPEAVRMAGTTDITSGTGMANIPATVPSTGQTHKDYEIQQRKEQDAYIPPGMTTSAGEEVTAQPGGGIDARQAWIDKTSRSPAARAGVFSDEERWQTHLANQRWRKEKGRSYSHGDYL